MTTAAILARDSIRTCSRPGCGTAIACPAEADGVVCPVCYLHQPGPFLDADQARSNYVRQVHTEHAQHLQGRLRRARGER